MSIILFMALTIRPDLVIFHTGGTIEGDIRQVDEEGIVLGRPDGKISLKWEEIRQARRDDGTRIARPRMGEEFRYAWVPKCAPQSAISDTLEAAVRTDGEDMDELRSLLASRDLPYARWRAEAELDDDLKERFSKAVAAGEKRLSWEIELSRARRDSSNVDVLARRAAVEKIGAIPIVEATNELIRALGDTDHEVRASAAESLRTRHTAGSVYLLGNVLATPVAEARAEALGLLERWIRREPETWTDFLRAAPRLDAPARAAAYEWIGRKRDPETESLLSAAATFDIDPASRAAAIRALGNLGATSRRSVVERALGHDSWRIRQAGAEAAALLRFTDLLPRVRDLLDDSSPSVREAAQASCKALETEVAGGR